MGLQLLSTCICLCCLSLEELSYESTCNLQGSLLFHLTIMFCFFHMSGNMTWADDGLKNATGNS